MEEEYQDRVDFKMYDVAGINDELKQQYKYIGYPQIVMLDAQGKIVFNRLGYQTHESLKADLDAVLAQR